MTNIYRIIITLLVVAMTLTACAVSDQSADTTAYNSTTPTTEQDVVPVRQNLNTNIRYTTLEKTNSVTETPSEPTPSEQATPEETPSEPESSTPTTPSEPPFDDSSPTEAPPAPQEPSPVEQATSRPYLEMEQEAIRLVNLEREKVGLPPYETDETYYGIVRLRAKESTEFWSHTRPNGQAWSSLYMELESLNGIRKIAENLGKNFTTVERITECLMASDGHRKAILGADYTHICIAIVLIEDGSGENRYAIAQHFYQKED